MPGNCLEECVKQELEDNEEESVVGRRQGRRHINTKSSVMGSNVSRHSGKGLSGRRTQSSGNLCNGAKILAPTFGRFLNPCGAGGGVSPRDRNKFCGSLPNHLDEKDIRSGEVTPESIYNGGVSTGGNNNNYGEVYNVILQPTNLMNQRNLELHLHKILPSVHDNIGGDQGYGTDRSPEEEHPLPLPHSILRRKNEFPFITKDNTFEAVFQKGSRGLGLSVTGGSDSTEQFPGLVRIKRIFPHQPAWECGVLQLGDIILAANGVPLTGLTNYEALEVLRTTPNEVVLKVCRPPEELFVMLPPGTTGEPPQPPRRDPTHVMSSLPATLMLPLPQLVPEPYGEFDIVVKKVNGSLGFTLRKEDESILGHYVRALVREPALSDGRIRPGDKIVAVNDVDISPMSHEEAVMFLRQSGEEVRLRLYRDPAQTPVSALSPTESHKTFKPKPALRKEAMDMLCDLAVKKLSPSDSSSSSGKSRLKHSSPGSSPRRRKLTKTPTLLDGEGNEDKPQRPNFLDLCGGNTTPATMKRHKFQLVNLSQDDDTDSAQTSGSCTTRTTIGSSTRMCLSSDDQEPSSMPPLAGCGFSHSNPTYHSAHPGTHTSSCDGTSSAGHERSSDQDIPNKVLHAHHGNSSGNSGGAGSKGLLKWKGVVFTPEDGIDDDDDSTKEITPKNDSSFDDGVDNEKEVLTVELCRGWNSRLGFSLQKSGDDTIISAVYADSVAAKDGRLLVGDQVIMINDDSTENMATSDVIDLLRKIRGTIAITVLRSKNSS